MNMVVLAAAMLALGAGAAEFNPADVLVYTRWRYVKNQKTGEVAKGGDRPWAKPYHHESTEYGAEEVRRYFTANGLSCLVTDDPEVFVSSAMGSFKAVMLCNCNNELFDTDAQRESFYRFLEATRWAMGELPVKVAAKSAMAVARKTIDGVECVKDGKAIWKFNIANRENKPFVHPLCLPDGRCVTDARPDDHPWHLGLWFCWKYINGVNYWEPRDPAQSNLFPDGMTVVKDFKIEPKGAACDVSLSLWYGPRAEPGKVLLEEDRRVSFSEPDAHGAYSICSKHVFTAREKVTLDARRPVAYGGFSLRMAPMVRGFAASGSGGAPNPSKNIGGPKGMTLVRYEDPETEHGIEVRMLSPIETERFYTWSDHRFVNPMPIYDRPLTMAPGESISLEYEVRVF